MKFRYLFLSISLFPFFSSGNQLPVIDQQINNQISQDKSRQQQTQLETKDTLNKKVEKSNNILIFSEEKNCFEIKQVTLIIEPKLPSMRPLQMYANQVIGHCIGINGVQTLAKGLQDKIIKTGYITTRVTIPEQNIGDGNLILQIIPGKVANIKLTDDSYKYINLSTVMPTKKGDILNLRDIEQGLENKGRLRHKKPKQSAEHP